MAKPLKELFAYLPAREFGPAALKTLRARMIELDWSRKTVNKSVTRVRSIFKWGVSEELVPAELLARLASVAEIVSLAGMTSGALDWLLRAQRGGSG